MIPGLPRVQLDPELILLIFLPPLLYSAAPAIPPRELRENLRPISLLAFGLVLLTMTVVAAVAIANRLGLPRRLVSILEGEGLFNDATALVPTGSRSRPG